MALAEDMQAPEMAPGEAVPEDMLSAIAQMPNIAEALDEANLGEIGQTALEEYEIDRESMKEWLERSEKGIELAKLLKKDKTYPFPNAANVKYPLLTHAAIEFNAKAYPAIVAADQVVKVKVYGMDPGGLKAKRGERIAEHMSWQLTCQIEEWEEETDKLLTVLPIVGTVARKVWFNPARGRTQCKLIEAGRFIVNDKVRVLSDAPRVTEELDLYPGEIAERVRLGMFRDIDYDRSEQEEAKRDTQKPHEFIEQHRLLDLDEDGYEEPYIVTVHKATKAVARIVADFEPQDVMYGPAGVQSIRRNSYFVAYHFMPPMDGRFWSTGLGALLADISDSINSIMNLMLDAGHMASRGGGFIGSDFRIKGGSQQFRPGEWKLVPDRGAAIKEAIVPLTFPAPDATLFQLLGLLIDSGKQIAAVKDVVTGENTNSQMPASLGLALIEQGMAVFTAAYKRIFRSLKHEFKLIARINQATVGPEEYNAFHDETDAQGMPIMLDPAAEYDMSDMDIVPLADPASVTRMQTMAKAQFVMQMAEGGLLNPQWAAQQLLQAAQIANWEDGIPQPDPMQQQMAQLQMQLEQAKLEKERAQGQLALAQTQMLQFELPAEQMKAQASMRKAEADQVKAESEGRRAAIAAVADQQQLRIDAMKAEGEAVIAADEQRRKWAELEIKRAEAAAKIRNMAETAETARIAAKAKPKATNDR